MAVHSGRGYLNEDREEGWKRGRDMLARLADYAGTKGITLAMESLRPDETNLATTVDDVKRMLTEINHPNFKAMIDTCPMGVAGETLQQWFDTLGAENIVHMHFIDGTPYGHLIWGDGNHNLKNWLETVNKNGYTGLFKPGRSLLPTIIRSHLRLTAETSKCLNLICNDTRVKKS